MNFIRHRWNDFAVVVVVDFNWCFAFALLLGELLLLVLLRVRVLFLTLLLFFSFIVIAIIRRGPGGSSRFLEYLVLFIFASPIAGWGWM